MTCLSINCAVLHGWKKNLSVDSTVVSAVSSLTCQPVWPTTIPTSRRRPPTSKSCAPGVQRTRSTYLRFSCGFVPLPVNGSGTQHPPIGRASHEQQGNKPDPASLPGFRGHSPTKARSPMGCWPLCLRRRLEVIPYMIDKPLGPGHQWLSANAFRLLANANIAHIFFPATTQC